jgi:hypothetical protein
MTTVETVGRIRRAHLVQKLSVREIARRLHVSRKTVRKAIEAEDGSFSYERAVQPMPKLGGHVAELERLLAENEGKPRRERLTLIRLFEGLRGQDMKAGTMPLAAMLAAGSARRRDGPRPRSCR